MSLSRREFFRQFISRKTIQENLDLIPSPLSGLEEILSLGEEPSMEKVALELGRSVRRRPSLDFSAIIPSDSPASDGAGIDVPASPQAEIHSSVSSAAPQDPSLGAPDAGAGMKTKQT